jgi:hypothetical protein
MNKKKRFSSQYNGVQSREPRTLLACVFTTIALVTTSAAWAAKQPPTGNPTNNTTTGDATGNATGSATSKAGNGPNSQSTAPAIPGNAGPIESQILAYESLERRSTEIATFVEQATTAHTEGASSIKRIVVLDANQLTTVSSYAGFLMQAEALRAQLCNAVKQPTKPPTGEVATAESVTAVSAIVTAAASAITGLVGMFKETKTVTASAILLPDEALVAAVGSKLASRPGVEYFYPTEYPIGLGEALSSVNVPITVADACRPFDSAASAYQRLAILQFVRVATGANAATINAQDQSKIAPIVKSSLAALTAANANFDASLNSWSATDPATNTSGWIAILRGEKLSQKLANHASVVELKIQSAGGEQVSLDGLFFITGASYYYSGGVIVTAIVFDATSGAVKASKNFWEVIGDRKRQTFTSVHN